MSLEAPLSLRRNTKKYAKDERKEAAKEIHKIRDNRFKEEKLIKEKVEKTKIKENDTVKGIEILKVKMNDIEKSIKDLKTSIIKKLFNVSKISQLNNEKKGAKDILENLLLEKKSFEIELQNLNQELEKKSNLKKEENFLREFYKKQVEMLPSYEAEEKRQFELEENDRKASNLRQYIENQEVVVFHCFRLGGDSLDGNSIADNDAPWSKKLKALIALEPTISASSLNTFANFPPQKLWRPFGAIINNGEVLKAANFDIGTVARGLKTRNIDNIAEKGKLREEITWNIRSSGPKYNEVVIENPSVSGLFILDVEEEDKTRKNMIPKHEEIHTVAEELNLPVYIFSRGEYWKAIYSSGKYIKSEQVKNPSLPDTGVAEVVKTKTKEEILNNFPIEIEGWKDFADLSSAASGRIFYSELGTFQILPRLKSENHTPFGEKITSFCGPGSKYNIYKNNRVINGGYLLTTTNSLNKIEREWKYLSYERAKGNYLWIGRNTYSLAEGIYGIRGYTEAIGKTITRMQKKINENSYEKNENKAFLDIILRRLAFHAFGFSEQAREFGDTLAADAALSVAEKVLPYEEYKKILEKRIGPNGEMKVTEEDIKELE